MPSRTINGSEIHYSEQGSGLAVVLLHGFPLDRRIWDAQLQGLRDICCVITPDLPGYAQSTAAGTLSVERWAEDVHELLGQIGALPCILGGLSMGGYVALEFAMRFGSDLRGLILANTRANADAPQAKANRDATIELAKTKGAAAVVDQMFPKMISPNSEPQFARNLRRIMNDCTADTIQRVSAALRDRQDYTAILADISVPTLIIGGEQDQLSPPNVAESLHQAIRGSTLAFIPGADHVSPMEQPALVNAAIRTWIIQAGLKR